MVCTIKVGDKLLEMAKDLGIQHSVSSSSKKIWANFFHKKALHGETIYPGNFFFFFFWGGGGWGVYMGTNDQIMQGGKLMVKWFQMSSPVSSSSD